MPLYKYISIFSYWFLDRSSPVYSYLAQEISTVGSSSTPKTSPSHERNRPNSAALDTDTKSFLPINTSLSPKGEICTLHTEQYLYLNFTISLHLNENLAVYLKITEKNDDEIVWESMTNVHIIKIKIKKMKKSLSPWWKNLINKNRCNLLILNRVKRKGSSDMLGCLIT